jgi:hypothetical protein
MLRWKFDHMKIKFFCWTSSHLIRRKRNSLIQWFCWFYSTMYSCAISTNLSAPFVIFKYHRQYHKTLIYNIHVFQVSRPTLILCCVFIIPSPTKLRRDIVTLPSVLPSFLQSIRPSQGWIQDFKLGGGVLKKIAPSGGRHGNFWGISCEKSLFYAKK